MLMDIRKIKKLIELVEESGIAELEISEGEESVRISRNFSGQVTTAMPQMMMQPAMAPAAAPAASAAAPTAEAAAPSGHLMRSPMVGSFYRSSSPGGKALVEVGDAVKEGQPVCIIEAMKIMNEIESDKTGTIVKVLCDNGQAVEYGQPLFMVE